MMLKPFNPPLVSPRSSDPQQMRIYLVYAEDRHKAVEVSADTADEAAQLCRRHFKYLPEDLIVRYRRTVYRPLAECKAEF